MSLLALVTPDTAAEFVILLGYAVLKVGRVKSPSSAPIA
jgi:hypothetical protein